MKKLAVTSALLLTLYALFGFFAAPRLLKSKLIETIKEQTGLDVSVGKVKTNPFALSATLRDFEMSDRMGERLTRAQQERRFALYRGTFNEDPYLLSPEKDVAGNKVPREVREAAVEDLAYKRLVAGYSVSDTEFRALAQSRAAVIKDHMVATGGVEEIRIFLQDAEIDAEAVLGEVRMKLSLDAR